VISQVVVDVRERQTLVGFLASHYTVRNRPAYIQTTVTALPGLVPADRCWFREFTNWPPRVTLAMNPPEAKRENSEQALERHLNAHPGIAYRMRTYDPQAIQLSDFLTTSQLHHTALYKEYYQPLGVTYQISVALSLGPGAWVLVALGRTTRDFSTRDRRRLNVLLPHLIEGYRNACAISAHCGDSLLSAPTAATNFVSLYNASRARFVPSHVRTLLTAYLGPTQRVGHLPDPLQRWIRHHTPAPTGGRELPRVRQPFIVEGPGTRLVVRLFSDGDQHSLFLHEEISDHLLPMRSLGLTARETQILHWLALGRQNREIAVELNIRPRTVSKHLERIFLKLGVESRTSAVMKALGLIAGPRRRPGQHA
jgi:DNA-binding CsgD family transcriptional regulator